MKTYTLSVAVVLLGVAATMVQAQDASSASAESYRTNPKLLAAVKDAREMEREKRPGFAIDDYKKANKIAGGRCIECMTGLYGAQMMDGSYKDAINTAKAIEALAATPIVKSVAAYDRGRALMARDGDKPKPEQLEEARAAFQEAVDVYPQNMAALFNDAEVLARLGKTDDARKDFQLCLSQLKPADPAYLRVKHFAEDPELATHKMAPAFEVTALDGSKFNLDAMDGRVVLVDFWATWCGPCNEELPELKRIAKKFAGQPLVMISVSLDKDGTAWKEFVQKHDMTWVQYRDADHKLADEFGVSEIPHYFTIDSDGVLTSEMMGSGSDVDGKLKKLIAKAEEARVQAGQAHMSSPEVNAGRPAGR
ncbi:MAG: redoxin domain-containing protein [Acidobacteriaceae bacterium]